MMVTRPSKAQSQPEVVFTRMITVCTIMYVSYICMYVRTHHRFIKRLFQVRFRSRAWKLYKLFEDIIRFSYGNNKWHAHIYKYVCMCACIIPTIACLFPSHTRMHIKFVCEYIYNCTKVLEGNKRRKCYKQNYNSIACFLLSGRRWLYRFAVVPRG